MLGTDWVAGTARIDMESILTGPEWYTLEIMQVMHFNVHSDIFLTVPLGDALDGSDPLPCRGHYHD